MLEPAVAEKSIPVLANPEPDRMIAQISPFLLTLNPLEALGLLLTAPL